VRDAARRTLVAVSGGTDSAAMMLALASRPREVVVGHVVHDLRPARQSRADAGFVRQLATTLGLAYREARVAVRALPGNAEANARRLRYAALAEMAREAGCRYVAVAHQADDLAETMLMRLLRGSGPRGLGVLRARRPLAPDVTLIRPMLTLTRAQTRRLCRLARITPRHDATNDDTTRMRAALRTGVMPRLARLSPGYQRRLAASASLLAQAGDLIATRAARVLAKADHHEDSIIVPRANLRRLRPIILGEMLRQAARRLSPRAADQIGQRVLAPIVRGVLDDTSDPRTYTLGVLRVGVTARAVQIARVVTSAPIAPRPRRPSRSAATASGRSTQRTRPGRRPAGASAPAARRTRRRPAR